MAKTPKEIARELFIELRDNHNDKLKLVNEWIADNTESDNLPIFLAQSAEDDQKKVCVMIADALKDGDFSAFEHDDSPAPSSKDKEPDEPEDKNDEEDEKEEEEPPAPAKEDKPKPKPSPAKPTEPALSSSDLVGNAVRTVAGAVALKVINDSIPRIVDAVIEKLGTQPKAESKSDSLTKEDVEKLCKEQIKATLKAIL